MLHYFLFAFSVNLAIKLCCIFYPLFLDWVFDELCVTEYNHVSVVHKNQKNKAWNKLVYTNQVFKTFTYCHGKCIFHNYIGSESNRHNLGYTSSKLLVNALWFFNWANWSTLSLIKQKVNNKLQNKMTEVKQSPVNLHMRRLFSH